MDLPKVERWDDEKLGEMTLGKIQEMFTPGDHFRISRYEYPAGAESAETSREGVCYVLQGQVTYRSKKFGVEISLSAGEFTNLPSGSYGLSVGKNEAVSLVRVWELPAEFWRNLPK
jgi:quercetin dioxygenase-like cupin family protein